MTTCSVFIQKVSPSAIVPKHETPDSAGVDLHACIEEEICIRPMQRVLVSTGISIELPKGYEAQIRPRSGLAHKHGITVLNSPGTIDADYRGEIKIILINLSENDFIIENGMRIAQMVVAQHEKVNFQLVANLTTTERGSHGFGSTGVK